LTSSSILTVDAVDEAESLVDEGMADERGLLRRKDAGTPIRDVLGKYIPC
jgi:hypothetical protein